MIHFDKIQKTIFIYFITRIMITMEMRGYRSRKTQPARGWTAAGIFTNCVYIIPAHRDGGPIPFLGNLAIAPCRLAGSAPHISGGRRVKSWPDDTHKQTPVIRICDICHKPKKTRNKPQSYVTTHTHST